MKRESHSAPRLGRHLGALCAGLVTPLLVACVSGPIAEHVSRYDPLFTTSSLPPTPVQPILESSDQASCAFAGLGSPLSLFEAAERALCDNPKTRETWASMEASAAELGIARSAYLPKITATIDQTRSTVRYFALDQDLHQTARNREIRLTWLLMDFGARGASVDRSKALLSAASFEHLASLQQTFLKATQAYYDAISASGARHAAREAEHSAYESVNAAEAKYKAGIAAAADVLQAKTSRANATLDRVRADGDLASANGVLATLMGLAANTGVNLPDLEGTPVDDNPQPVLDDLLTEAQQKHPALAAARARVEAAQAAVRSNRAAGLPTVALNAGSNRTSSIAGEAGLASVERSSSIGVQISMPLFEGFLRHYQVRSSEADTKRSEAQLADSEQQVTLEVWRAFQNLQSQAESVRAAEVLVSSARESFRVALGRYRSGLGSITDLLSAQSAQAAAEQQRIKSLSAWYAARLRLAASTGRLDLAAIK